MCIINLHYSERTLKKRTKLKTKNERGNQMVLIIIFLLDSGKVVRPKQVRKGTGARERLERKRFFTLVV